MILLPFKWDFPENKQNHFGAVRKHDIHTGVDIFAPEGTDVLSVADGKVVQVGYFTGPNAKYVSPWWNETFYVMIENPDGYIFNYGEILPIVKEGDIVHAKQKIGTVQTVLKKDKGLPMSMVHFEMYRRLPECWAVWEIGDQQPELLIDPTLTLELCRCLNDRYYITEG